MMLYNKLFDCTNFKYIEKIDSFIYGKIIEPIIQEVQAAGSKEIEV